MTSTHDRLANIISLKNTIAAVDAIQDEYILIRIDELPKAIVANRNGEPHVEVIGADWGTWPLKHPQNTPERQRRLALEYLAAERMIELWQKHEAEDALTKRRDELAVEFGCPTTYSGITFNNPLRLAIDRIIDMEKNAE